MKLINNQLLEETEKFNIVIWITVSNEINITRLQDGIARALRKESNLSQENDETRRAGVLYEMLAQEGKYVLILDDVWEAFSLEEVGIPEPSNGSKIMITTRLLNVCQYFGAQEVRLQTLSGQDAWNLFLKKAGEDILDHPHLLPIVKSVAEECGGLPLAIVTIASSMKGVRNINEWRNALNELSRCVQSVSGSNEKIFQQLQFSYDRLEHEKVKYCFLYLALYPEDREVKKVELIEKWIEEGFVEEMDSMQAEIDKGHAIMNKLINNCLFETSRNSDFVSLHDLMRDMALHITSARRSRFLVKAGMQLEQIPAVREWTEDLEKVSFLENRGLQIPLNISPPKCGRLTTLLLGSCGIWSTPECFFEHMHGLKVLDLSNNLIKSVPASIINLKDLRILLLYYCKNLEKVPSFSNLEALKKLNLAHTKIQDVPHGLERLVNLQQIDLRETGITKVVDGLLAKLTSLRSLELMKFEANSCASVRGEEIGGLKKLERFKGRFCELGELNHYVQAGCAPTIRLCEYCICVGIRGLYTPTNFELKRRIEIWCGYIPVDGIKIPSNIEALRIEGCIANLLHEEEAFFSCFNPVPHDIFSSLSFIEVYDIEKIKKLFSFNWMLRNLQNLRELHVGRCDEMEEIIASESDADVEGIVTINFALPRLKQLVLWKLPRLKSICSANRVMVCDSIERIIIRHCPKLKRLPLYLPLREDDGQPSPPPPLQSIIIDYNNWREMMEWDHPNAQSLLQPFVRLN